MGLDFIGVLVGLFSPLIWVWKKLRVFLPFSIEKKIVWNLRENLRYVDWAIEEKDLQHFEQELRKLYPKIERYGLQIPLLEPVRIGINEYDSTWHGYHLTFLKVLRRWVRNNEFDVKQWNVDVVRENAKRKEFAQKIV